jgi:hypothetical protein
MNKNLIPLAMLLSALSAPLASGAYANVCDDLGAYRPDARPELTCSNYASQLGYRFSEVSEGYHFDNGDPAVECFGCLDHDDTLP